MNNKLKNIYLPIGVLLILAIGCFNSLSSIEASKKLLAKQWIEYQEIVDMASQVPNEKTAINNDLDSTINSYLKGGTLEKKKNEYIISWNTPVESNTWIKVIEVSQTQLGSKPKNVSLNQNNNLWTGKIVFTWR